MKTAVKVIKIIIIKIIIKSKSSQIHRQAAYLIPSKDASVLNLHLKKIAYN